MDWFIGMDEKRNFDVFVLSKHSNEHIVHEFTSISLIFFGPSIKKKRLEGVKNILAFFTHL